MSRGGAKGTVLDMGVVMRRRGGGGGRVGEGEGEGEEEELVGVVREQFFVLAIFWRIQWISANKIIRK